MGEMDKSHALVRSVGVVLVLVGSLLLSSGCTRQFYRRWADKDVAGLLREKDVFPQWRIQDMNFYPDPRSRFAPAGDPNRPPMPPDDPAAKLLAPNPQRPGHAGVGLYEGTGYLELLAHWDTANRARRAEDALQELEQEQKTAPSMVRLASFQTPRAGTTAMLAQPAPLQPPAGPDNAGLPSAELPELKMPRDIGTTPGGAVTGGQQTGMPPPFLLNINQAAELGVFNSREFQTQRENLYLTALPVTSQRFSFAAQFLAFGNVIRERAGSDTPLGKGDRWIGNASFGVGKLFSTGALLLAQFANQTIIELTNPTKPHTTSVSTINLDFIQPLLRGGGRAVTLEPLTLAERNLLYQIRGYARFRKQYYQFLTAGAGASGGNNAPAAFSAITSTFPLGAGGIGAPLSIGLPVGLNVPITPAGVGAAAARPSVTPGNSGSLFLTRFPGAPAVGYLPILFNVVSLEADRANVRELEEALRLFIAYEQGGEVSSLQVGQVQLQLLSQQSTVLNDEVTLRDNIDFFKLQLGVPLTVQLELDDTPLRPVRDQIDRFSKAIKDFEATAKEVDELDAGIPAQIRKRLLRIFSDSPIARKTQRFKKEVPARWAEWQRKYPTARALVDRLETLGTERRKLLDRKSSLEEKEQPLPPREAERLKYLDREIPVGELELAVRRYEVTPWEKAATAKAKRIERAARWRDVRNAAVLILGEAGTERLDAIRPRWPELPPIVICGVDIATADLEQAYAAVMKVALENRLDLMNARAQVVDAWRQVRILANALLGTFNVAYHLDSSTPPGMARPFAFQPERTRHQLVMNWELPLVRIYERNAFRASLIAYERARRALMEAEDTIADQVRSEVRVLQFMTKNYKIQQQSVELSYLQVESALETFRAPPAPGAGGGNAASAAALTNQLLTAYRGLPANQKAVYGTWIDFLRIRQQLYLDTELMQIGPQGVWIDEFTPGKAASPTGEHEPADAERPRFGPPLPADAAGPAAVGFGAPKAGAGS